MGIAARSQVHADAIGTPNGNHRIGYFKHEPGAVFDGATIDVRAMIGFVLEELIQQVAVGTMDFHTVKAGELGVFRAGAIGLNDAGNLFQTQCPGRDKRFQRTHQADVTRGGDGARSNRQGTVQKLRIGNAPDVPELEHDAPAGLMHGPGDELPAVHLRGGPDSRRVGVTHTHRGDRGRLGDDQADRGPLGVVFGHQRIGDARRAGPRAGQRSENDAVGQAPGADADGIK